MQREPHEIDFHALYNHEAKQLEEALQAYQTAALSTVPTHYDQTPLPAWTNHLDTLTPAALAQINATLAMGERIGYLAGWEDGARTESATQRHLGRLEGRCELLTELAASNSAYLTAHARELAANLANTPSYADLCERRGEKERAQRARVVLAERGIA